MNVIIRDLDKTRIHFEAAVARLGEQAAMRAFRRTQRPAGGGAKVEGEDGLPWFWRLGHDDLLFAVMSEARGLAGEGCSLARPRRVVCSCQVPSSFGPRGLLSIPSTGHLERSLPLS